MAKRRIEPIEKKTLEAIEAIVREAEYMKNAYFFAPPRTASGRRSYEARYSHDEIEWTDGNDRFTAQFSVQCTCANVYAKGYYTRNGVKTTLTAVRNSYKRLAERYEKEIAQEQCYD